MKVDVFEDVRTLEHPPEVGKVYMVPTAITSEFAIPILGTLHRDEEFFGVEQLHYHYDLRFIDDKFWNHRSLFSSIRQAPIGLYLLQSIVHEDMFSKIVVQPLLCQRNLTQSWKDLLRYSFASELVDSVKAMEGEFRDERLDLGCKRCPHRGTNLSSIAPNKDGVIECPSHGLQWCAVSGKMIPRYPI